MQLIIYTNRLTNPLTGGEIYNKALIEAAERTGFEVNVLERQKLPIFFKNILVSNLYYLFKTIRSKNQGILLVDTDFHARCLLAVIYAYFFSDFKIVGLLHHYNYWDKKNWLSRKIHYILEKKISKKFHHLITNSNFSCNNFRDLTGKNIPTFILNPYVVNKNKRADNRKRNIEYPKKDTEKWNFLFVGTVKRRKNLPRLFHALKKLDCRYTFDVIGKIPSQGYFTYLKKIIREVKISDNIKFHGRLSEQKLEEFYRSSDIFLMVSIHEGYGMVYTEAMKHGLPIVAGNRGGVPELVTHEENGLLCNPFSSNQIKDNIERLLKDFKLRKRISENNREKYLYLKDRETFVDEAGRIFDAIMKK